MRISAVHVIAVDDSPINRRGGQTAYLLLASGQFGSERLAVTWVDCPPGSEQPVHRHDAQEQVYVITAGTGTMIVGDEEAQVTAGMLVFVPPATGHAIRNTGDTLLTYISATAPPFKPEELGDAFTFG
jgi:mannose-6-phosphate isomerase-like protein (cupin superfamily)